MYNWSFLFVVLHKPTLLPSTFNIGGAVDILVQVIYTQNMFGFHLIFKRWIIGNCNVSFSHILIVQHCRCRSGACIEAIFHNMPPWKEHHYRANVKQRDSTYNVALCDEKFSQVWAILHKNEKKKTHRWNRVYNTLNIDFHYITHIFHTPKVEFSPGRPSWDGGGGGGSQRDTCVYHKRVAHIIDLMHMTSQKGAQARWGSNVALPRAPSLSMQPEDQPLHAIPPGWPGAAHWLTGWAPMRSASTTRACSATSLDPQHGVVVMETWRQCIRPIQGSSS